MDVSACAVKRIDAHSQDGDVTAGYLTDDMNWRPWNAWKPSCPKERAGASLRIPLLPGSLQTAFLPGPYY
jgi:hypothetical protein